jgi:SAM-dependent methyltransferase
MDWHSRFLQQSQWTSPLRRFLIQNLNLLNAHSILDVGCGTGVLTHEFSSSTNAQIVGVDINIKFLRQALRNDKKSSFIQADGYHLPHADHTFDLVFCHFVLLWIHEPLWVVSEMKRVTRPGGVVAAFAEPDYGGRIDYPTELQPLAAAQQISLRSQGADPEIGRKVASIFIEAGLCNVECGVMGGQWKQESMVNEWDQEWSTLEDDLQHIGTDTIRPSVNKLKLVDRNARLRGDRILFVPTFYAVGIGP